jgi:hypothetical protein
MPQPHNLILNSPAVRAALENAWIDSASGVSGGHEEGGFVTADANGTLEVVRWPSELQNRRQPDCSYLPYSSQYWGGLFARARRD